MKRYALLTAAAVAVGGMAFAGCDNERTASSTNTTTPRTETVGDKVDRAGDATADAARATADAAGAAVDKTGDKLANAAESASATIREGTAEKGTAAAPDAEGIRDIVASTTEAALTEGGLDDLVERLVDADRNRIGEGIEKDFPDHTALVKQFRIDWKAKYGQEFNIKNEERALPATAFTVRQGEIGEAAPSGAQIATGQRAGDLDTNREEGRNIAEVMIKESHGMPALSVPLIHEMPDNWRIDVPDSVNADKLAANVMAHLKAAHDMRAQWPANVQDAYGAVSHHVMQAIMDKPVTK